jgi:DNA-binding CsgD family transcriptional regulator
MAKAGSKWLKDEENQLVDEVKSGKTFNEIALLHNRHVGGIYSRLKTISAKMILEDNANIDEIATLFHIDKEYIENEIKNMKTRKERRFNKQNQDSSIIMNEPDGHNGNKNNLNKSNDNNNEGNISNNGNEGNIGNDNYNEIKNKIANLEEKVDKVLLELANLKNILI